MTNKHGENVRHSILETGLKLWGAGGEKAVTSRAIGMLIRLSHAAVLYHFDYSTAKLRNAVAEYAVKVDDLSVILQLISSDHSAVSMINALRLEQYRKLLALSQAKR